MDTIARRDLRNNSSEVLARVSNGESIAITNHGRLAAIISPPRSGPLERSRRAGSVRGPRNRTVRFDRLPRARLEENSAEVLADLHCAASRRGRIESEAVNAVLDAVALVDLDRGDLLRAGTSSWGLRSADAIHLAVALRLETDTLVAYDTELLATARTAGLTVVSPVPGDREDEVS